MQSIKTENTPTGLTSNNSSENPWRVAMPEYYWSVTVPKGGHFKIMYERHELNTWQRFGMRLIGWGVEKCD